MWLTALILGFAGSMHCLGMCAPLVLAVTSLKPSAMLNRVIYNAGRILTYGILGAIVASAGMIFPLYRYQDILSIALGLSLLALGLGLFQDVRAPALTSLVQKATSRIKSLFGKHLAQKTHGAMFILGMLNGLLPCGLTLIALTWCVALKGPGDGLNFMLLFGAGTLPVMLGFTGMLPVLVKNFNISIGKLTTSMLIISGCILIARALVVHVPDTGSGGIIEILCRQ